MRPADEIKDVIRRWNDRTSAQMDERTLGDIERALKQSQAQGARGGPPMRSVTMRNPIVKLAIAAAIIAAVVLGLFEFVSNNGGSGVVWAEVAEKVQATSGLVLRCTESSSFVPDEGDYAMKYFTPTRARTDSYNDGEIVRSIYDDLETMTFVGLFHPHKHYQ